MATLVKHAINSCILLYLQNTDDCYQYQKYTTVKPILQMSIGRDSSCLESLEIPFIQTSISQLEIKYIYNF